MPLARHSSLSAQRTAPDLKGRPSKAKICQMPSLVMCAVSAPYEIQVALQR